MAPSNAGISTAFTVVDDNSYRHAALLSSVQKLRGAVYVEDGAVSRSELTSDGRYVQPMDDHAWHIVRLNEEGRVCGCARYMLHPWNVDFEDTGISKTPLSRSWEWASTLRAAVESDINLARNSRVDYVEVGGWALAPELRCTSEALRIALGTYSMARLLGGCIGITMATKRHCSASILRRIGGQSLCLGESEIPAYFDPRFDCEMEILRFDSEQPNPRFERWIEELKVYLSGIPVIRGSVSTGRRMLSRDPQMTAA